MKKPVAETTGNFFVRLTAHPPLVWPAHAGLQPLCIGRNMDDGGLAFVRIGQAIGLPCPPLDRPRVTLGLAGELFELEPVIKFDCGSHLLHSPWSLMDSAGQSTHGARRVDSGHR